MASTDPQPVSQLPAAPGQRLAKGSLTTLDAVAISISILAPGMAMLLNVPGVALIAGGSTPLAFLLSTARNCRQLSDVLALALGLALFPLVSLLQTGVDILISGVSAGTIAYGVHRWKARA